MAYPNNQRLNSPSGQPMQQFPGIVSPVPASPVIPGQAMPGMMYPPPPVVQNPPFNISPQGFLPMSQSSPLGQIPASVPQINQGPHMQLFASRPGNPQQQVSTAPRPVVQWGAGAITGPNVPGNPLVPRFGSPQGSPYMQPGIFGPPLNLPPQVPLSQSNSQNLPQRPPHIPVSQPNPQNFNNNYTPISQRPGNYQERKNDRSNQESNTDRERSQHNRQHDRDKREEREERAYTRGERDNKYGWRSDKEGCRERSDDRGENYGNRFEQNSGRHRQHRGSGRDDRSRDDSRGREMRGHSHDYSPLGHRRARSSGHGHQRVSDRPPNDAEDYSKQGRGRTGAVLLEDRDEHVSVGRSGAVLMEDTDMEPGERIGKTGAILKDDRGERSHERSGPRDDHRLKHGGRGRGRGDGGSRRDHHGNRRESRAEYGMRSESSGFDRAHKRESSRESHRSHSRDRSETRDQYNPSKRTKMEHQRIETEGTSDWRDDKGSNSEGELEPPAQDYTTQWRDAHEKKKMQEYLSMKEHSKYWDALKNLDEENETETSKAEPEDETPAWVRCSSADLYFNKDAMTGCCFGTKKLQDLERRFEKEIVQRNEKMRKDLPAYEPPSKLSYLHFHDEDSDSSSNDSDSEVENEIMEDWMKELKKKQEHPHRLHPEIWHNEPGQLNDGLLCRCSLKHRKTGIRHNIFPGEKTVPQCDPNSNNKDKLYHYRISMAPTTNFLSKTPSVIHHDNHEYIFEGFSLFTHNKIIEKMPLCKLMRFSIIYTLYTIDETFPENFTIRSLDLFSQYLFTEVLELFDLDWYGARDDNSCKRFHVMPRFVRPLPENGKEVLSMNEVLQYLLRSTKPLLDPTQLSTLLKLNRMDWTNFVDDFRGMIVTCPGRKPTSLRIDQLDKSHCEENDGGSVSYPLIVHCGIRPAQLSYAGDPEYKKKWREYMKFRHLYFNRPKIAPKDKEKLEEMAEELMSVRLKSTMKRDVTVELSAEGFYKTGIRTDICQHALLLPVLFGHLRFHDCLGLFEEQIGYTFKDRYLLQLAFTHCSYKVNFGTNPDHIRNSLSNCGNRMVEMGDTRTNIQHTRKKGLRTLMKIMSTFGYKHEMKSEIPHNERLEFLGDSVIEFLSSIHLFFMFPSHDEGELTTYRGSLVQNKNLTELAKKIHLEDYMLFAHGPDLCSESTMKHAMANCFEALMGALMLDTGMLEGGLQEADKVFSRCLFDEPDLLEIWRNVPEHPLQLEEPDGDRHWIESSPALQKLVKFEEMIGVEFKHIRLLARSFCHRSVGYNNLTLGNNQRLEFLGDTIIQLITSEYLYKHFPSHHEGHLTLLRASLVNNRTQATVCEELGMIDFVINTDNPSDTRHMNQHLRVKHKADLLEAFLGSLYVDGGLEFPKGLIEVCFFPRLEQFILNQDWNDPKSQLQQCCLVLRDPNDGDPDVPIYKIVNVTGPSNTRRYTVAVYFQGKRLATGSNFTIQSAEMEAAAKALMENKDRLLTPLFESSRWFKTSSGSRKAGSKKRPHTSGTRSQRGTARE